MQILVVDDSDDNRALLTRQLERAGYPEIVVRDSAEAALDYLRVGCADGPDVALILMDLVLPGVNGIEACRIIRGDARFQDTPILMVTVCLEGEELDAAFDAGATDYIQKPYPRSVLIARVRHALNLHSEVVRRKAREQELLETARQLEAANAALYRLSHQDGLTGIPNRRAFDETLEREWRRMNREALPLSVLLLDIDFFKRHNDRYGHAAGDECLRSIGRLLTRCLTRPGDLAARYGGEEFGALLPQTDLGGALHVAKRLRSAVAELELSYPGAEEPVTVTVSVGVATAAPGVSGSPPDLVALADRALYAAKAQGRNCVVSGGCLHARASAPDAEGSGVPAEGPEDSGHRSAPGHG